VRPLLLVGFKHEVPIDDHPHRKPRPDRERRLNIKITLHSFLTGLVQTIAGSSTERGDNVSIAASTGGRSKFAANAEQC
jgi:hypothetical protein